MILSGHWSTYTKYLFEKQFMALLRREIALRTEIDDRTYDSLKKRIENSANSVAVHVRRGDYREYHHIFTLVGEEYYKRAFELLECELRGPEYFIFSDEIDWVEKNLRFSRDVQFVKPSSVVCSSELIQTLSPYYCRE